MGVKEQDGIREILRAFAAKRNLISQTEDAFAALHKYGDELIEALIDALHDPDNDVRMLVLSLFWELGDKAEPALPVACTPKLDPVDMRV